jgi:hypothetical protein
VRRARSRDGLATKHGAGHLLLLLLNRGHSGVMSVNHRGVRRSSGQRGKSEDCDNRPFLHFYSPSLVWR